MRQANSGVTAPAEPRVYVAKYWTPASITPMASACSVHMPARWRNGLLDRAAASWARREGSASPRATAGARRVADQAPNMPTARSTATATPISR